ncbi:MAG: hypothetical protein HFJ84_08010 [Clostridiales bacterium]|nr:hypothetical protein [Clostridiales bacterium]
MKWFKRSLEVLIALCMVSLVGIAGSSDLNRTPLDQMLWIILFLTLSGIALTIGRFFVCLKIHRVEDVKNESLDTMQDVKFIKNGEKDESKKKAG